MMRPDRHPNEDQPSPDRHGADSLGAQPSASNCEHAPGHRTALRTVLELELGDALEAQDIVDGCPQCSDELHKLTDLRQMLDEAGASQRTVLGRARRALDSGQSAPGVELVAPFLRERFAGLQPRRKRFRLLAPLVAAAAALLVMVGWLVRSWFPRNDTPTGGVLLGDHNADGLSPNGEVTEYVPFRWPKLELPPGGSYSFRAWDPLEEDPSRVLRRLDSHKDNELWIERAELAAWPDRIDWEVQALDATGSAVSAPRRATAVRVKR